ncbi:hypothetical protein M426DRAFT_259843 [Hypoxylon sp. CI-4A]|nr:hypothetical protein M426DRAFT_259843 [Hypoxylon sp. CI-4A]
MAGVILAGVTLVAISIITKWIYNVYFHPLSSFPGPFIYRASQLPLRWHQVKGREPFVLAKLHKKYGPVVRIAPNDLSYTNVEAWKGIYGHHVAAGGVPLERNLPKSPDLDFYGALGLFSADGEDHIRQRRQLAPAFSQKSLREQEPLITRYIDHLMERFEEGAEAKRSVDLSGWLNFVTFDIIGDLMFGYDVFECIEKSRYHVLVSELLARFEVLAFAIAIQSIAPRVASLLNRLMPKRLREQYYAQANTIKNMVNKRLATSTTRPDFTTLVLREGREGGVSMLDNGEIYPTSAQIVLAGSETVATTLSGCIFLLLQHPDIMAKLKQEIRTEFRSDKDINFSALTDKKYLQAVLNEAMRVYPPTPASLRRCVPPEGCTILDKFIPGGTAVGFTPYPAYRDESNFRDADKFIPERWLGTNPRYEEDRRNAFEPFGFGPMNCIGINLAQLELHLILARLLWNFDIKLEPGSEDWFDQKVFVIWYRKPLPVRLVLRETSE